MNIVINAIIAFFVVVSSTAYGQVCQLPILSQFIDPSTSGFKITWLDFNSSSLSYEIEIGTKGFSRTLQPNISDIADRFYTFNSLASGTTYEIYIRTECGPGNYSQWNGPYFYNTIIENINTTCDLSLDISDNNCPNFQSFLIKVEDNNQLVLGSNVVLENVNIIIDHPWPPDLNVILMSPSGTRSTLSSNNGNGIDHYGDPNDCTMKAIFTDIACFSIDNYTPPFIGEFKPEESFASFNGENIEGLWVLEICDRAAGDLGQLKHIDLNFSVSACAPPDDFKIVNIEGNFVDVRWKLFENCEVVNIVYKRTIDPITDNFKDFVACELGEFRIDNLMPDTEYELYVATDCNDGAESPESCLIQFRTACENSMHSESFDTLPTCIFSCDTTCLINSIWKNQVSGARHWLVNEMGTPSEFTGPDGDINGDGRFLYVESKPEECPNTISILESDCLSNQSIADCNLTFYYHMYGNETGQLSVQVSVDNLNWTTIWSVNGNLGNKWNFAEIAINETFEYGKLRFEVTKGLGVIRSDIAIDQVKIIGLDTIPLKSFFVDNDGDGFGGEMSILICSQSAPLGYSDNNSDCNDNDFLINPDATEVSCNLTDDNCNGNMDESSMVDIIYEVVENQAESCKGISDGIIDLLVTNGQAPYSYSWSNGMTGARVENLSTGVYTCTIADIGGCQIVTEPLFVDFNNIITYSLATLTSPSCFGINDGKAQLLISGGTTPYDVDWGSNITGQAVENLAIGTYVITITDGLGCSIETNVIEVNAPQAITAGVALKRDVECFGDDNGFIQIGIVGGTPPYDITWDDGSKDIVLSQLESGNYSVTILDAIGCQNIIDNIVIVDPDPLEISISNIEHVSCYNGFNALIDVTISGGVAPYVYSWSEGSRTQDLFRKTTGFYSLTVVDFNTCITELNDIEILESPEIELDIDLITTVNCAASDNGQISVQVEGGQPPYLYNWSTSDGFVTNSSSLNSLLPGQYSLTVVDDFGCKSSRLNFEIINNDIPIEVKLEQEDILACFGDSTASISLMALNGNAPFDFNWSSGFKNIKDSPRDTVFGLISNSYNVTITDNEGCVGVSDSIAIISPEEISYTVIQAESNDCWFSQNGLIELSVSGGTPSYRINWNNNISGPSINNLSNGAYFAEIHDANECIIKTSNFIIDSPLEMNVEAQIEHASGNSGSVSLDVSGGINPYQFSWYDPIILGNLSKIEMQIPGEYRVSIEDSKGCIVDTSFIIEMIDAIDSPIDQEMYSIYPNPANHTIHIKSIRVFQSIELRKLDGALVYRDSNLRTNTYNINCESMADGVYLIKVISSGQEYVSSIIILNTF